MVHSVLLSLSQGKLELLKKELEQGKELNEDQKVRHVARRLCSRRRPALSTLCIAPAVCAAACKCRDSRIERWPAGRLE